MTSERIQRQIDRLLDAAEAALASSDWVEVGRLASDALRLDPENADARALLEAATRDAGSNGAATSAPASTPSRQATAQPTSFAGGRYEVRRFLGEGGKKRVFLAHDTRLDRDVAFALIKTDGLDEVGRERIVREAQAMGRLGAHPHIVTIFEIGEEAGSPYVVNELLAGGDVEGELEKAGGALPLARALEIAKGVARGLAFAHERGIVHRDLKPGNVWLTAEGTAKIGDFGLAVSLDRSRLTQHGMMVGTVAYMPPEQALGGEVTPQADLYSLGAMLYELVTGRPPFQADDPTAVISQHINTPPVAPSWHSEHCPPDLESLILRLLSKVPADRPATASELLAALEAVDPNARSASHSDSSANPLDRLARGVFVGRERELERLRAAFDDAFAGRGSVVMLVGEPGIGKTRTSLELETYARMRGGRVIWGRAHEAAGAPPYRPWVQAGDSYAQQFGLDGVGDRLEPGDGPELSRIFPGLRQQPNYVPPPEITDPDAAQFRLFEAYTHLLRAYAEPAPLLVVLDDLHWADKPSLLLLRHIAPEIGRQRILILGNYRDTELSRTHPLSETLAALNREGGFQRITLGGLAREEVASYVRDVAHAEPRSDLVDRIYEETEGNPFFLSEVVNLMAEEGALARESLTGVAIPEGVREALGRRLDRLSEEANALLQYAAVAGRQFAYDTLAAISDHDDATLLRLIEEGLEARVIEEAEQAGRYRFTHALMQETLLEELSTTRKVRMHGEVGEAIERRYGDRASEQAARLAVHFSESATLNASHAERAVRYSRLAGEQAEAQAAWTEAARQYENAVALLGHSDESPDAERATLLHALGRSQGRAGGFRNAWRNFMGAADLYRAQDSGMNLAALVIDALRANASGQRIEPLLMDAVQRLPAAERQLRPLLLAIRASLLAWSGSADARDALHEAQQMATESDSEAAGVLARVEARIAEGEGDYEAATTHYLRAWNLLPPGSWLSAGSTAMGPALGNQLGRMATLRGDLHGAIDWYERDLEVARSRGAAFDSETGVSVLAGFAVNRGDFGPARAIAGATMGTANILGFAPLIRVASATGEPLPLEQLPSLRTAGGIPDFVAVVGSIRANALLLTGRSEEARSEVAEVLAARDAIVSIPPTGMMVLVTFLGPCFQLTSPADIAWGYDFLNSTPVARMSPQGSIDYLRGFLALLVDREDEAEQHFRTGVEFCERERCPIEAGLCHQGLAEVAERRGDLEAAREHLDAAGELFAQWGAKRYLDQVLAKKEFLNA